MPSKDPSLPSTRQYRMGEMVRRALSEIMTRSDINLPILTITQVQMTPDLRLARVYFMGPESDLQTINKALNAARGRLQHALKNHLSTRYLPKLQFFSDHSLDQVTLIDRLLKDPSVQRDLSGTENTDA